MIMENCTARPIEFHGEVVQNDGDHKHYKADPKDLIGKTIVGFDCDAANVWSLTFSDGTAVSIETDLGPYQIPCMTLCNTCWKKGEDNG